MQMIYKIDDPKHSVYTGENDLSWHLFNSGINE